MLIRTTDTHTKEFKLSNKAKSDLISIATFTDTHWGKTKRNQYLKTLDDAFHEIAFNPAIGVKCDHISKGYRKLRCQKHIIYYTMHHPDMVFILRILHQSMDAKAHTKATADIAPKLHPLS